MMDGKKQEIKVTGIPELIDSVSAMQAEIDMLYDFAQDVLITLLIPDSVRYYFEDRYEGVVSDALDALSKHMYGYRKILDFFKRNGIDINKIISDTESKELN